MIDDIPQDWTTVNLGQVTVKVGSGATPRGGSESYQQAGIPLIRSMNVRFEGFHEEGLAFLNRKQADALKEVTVRSGDVLLNITGASIGRVTQAPPHMDGARVNQHVCIIRTYPELNPQYLARYLASPSVQRMIWTEQYGVTRQALTKGQIQSFEIPLPPTAEQRRIVARIDQLVVRANRVRDRLSRIPSILKRFRQAVLASACSGRLTEDWRESHPEALELLIDEIRQKKGKNFQTALSTDALDWAIPDSWRWSALGEIAEVVGGVTKGQKRRSDKTLRSVPYLRVANVQRGFLSLGEIKHIQATEEEISELRLLPRDILFTEGGDRDKLGRGWIWRGEIVECIHQNHIFRARLHSDRIQEKFVSCFANLVGQTYFIEEGKQTVNLASINLRKLRAFPVPLVPPSEQQEIVRRVEGLFKIADTIGQRFASASACCNKLTQSILAKAFRGELVTTEAELARSEGRGYESASVLLERIKKKRNSETPSQIKRRRPKSENIVASTKGS